MANQISPLSDQTQIGVPEKWQEHFLIKRIDEEPIEINLSERDVILKNLAQGQRYIQIGKYTLMLNSIKSIDPLYEPDNIPLCPKEKIEVVPVGNGEAKKKVLNQGEIDLWFKLFGENKVREKLLK